MTEAEHFDVIIVGAGLSGIGAAYHLQTKCPDLSFVVLEGRERLGGTWDLFRYPGIRSDSDMHTLGFEFKPWTADKAIADGPSILAYLNETADEYGITERIRFNHQVSSADWSSEQAQWTLSTTNESGSASYSANYLFVCSGYYSYQGGYRPDFPGEEDFEGQIVHPQEWPEDINYDDKSVVVIGSGATAVTLIPELAKTAKHVTMLQRSPTYMAPGPDVDRVANTLRKILPDRLAYSITRWKNTNRQAFLYKISRSNPDKLRKRLLGMVRDELGDDFDIDTHFTPSYNPWDQRLCLVPNGDLFKSIKAGRASVVTDRIDQFMPTGIRLASGDELETDIIVTATGLNLVSLGEISFSLDGEAIDFSETYTYKGMCYSGVPNMASTFGYVNASWTLRSDLIATYVTRILNHMAETSTEIAVPLLRPADANMATKPWIDEFTSGYMLRGMHLMPKQGDTEPWLNTQSYSYDKKRFNKADVDDGVMTFSKRAVAVGSGG